jgi:hypothetical protein
VDIVNEFGRLIFYMLAGHALADFALQSPWHSSCKYPDNVQQYPWYAGLGCHALIHGGLVGLITGYWLIGVAETIAHAGIDFMKGRGWIDSRTDQAMHFACKAWWATIAIGVTL